MRENGGLVFLYLTELKARVDSFEKIKMTRVYDVKDSKFYTIKVYEQYTPGELKLKDLKIIY